MIKKVVLILLCIINMMTITMFSTQNAEKSTQTSRSVTIRIISPITNKTEDEVRADIGKYDKYTRGFAHFVLFMTLGFLLYCAMRSFGLRNAFLYAFAVCFVYAVFDELYQEFFSNGRAFEWDDLLKDWFGSLFGMLIVFVMLRHANLHINKR